MMQIVQLLWFAFVAVFAFGRKLEIDFASQNVDVSYQLMDRL